MLEAAHLLARVADVLGRHAEPAADDGSDGDANLWDELQNKAHGKSASNGIQDSEVVKGVGGVVDEAQALERDGDGRGDDEGPGRFEEGVLAVQGRGPPPGRPDPPAHGGHDGQHEAVADAVEQLRGHAALARSAGGAAVRGQGDAGRVAQVGDAQDDLFGPAAGIGERDVTIRRC